MKHQTWLKKISGIAFFLATSLGWSTIDHASLYNQEETIALDQEYLAFAREYQAEKKIPHAQTFYKKALECNPKNQQALQELATLLFDEKNIREAIHYYTELNTLAPTNEQAAFNLGLCYEKQEDYPQAIRYFEQALIINDQSPDTYLHLSTCYTKIKNTDKALQTLKRGVQIAPTSIELLRTTARVLKEHGHFDQALVFYQRAVEVEPKDLNLLLELGNTYNMINEWEHAIDCYRAILDMRPNIPEVLYNLAYTLKKMGRIEEALPLYDKVLALRPTYAQALFSRSLAYLSLGDFERGWQEYEWRWQAYNESPKKFDQPMWHGEDLTGKTIFIYAEQGLGDTFQFVRYAAAIKDLGATIIVQVQSPLKKLISLCPYIDKVITQGEPIGHFDYHSAMMSLPLIFKTDLTTIPKTIPYLFADQELAKLWKERLASDTSFKIGICWHGNPNYRTQFLRQAVAGKSTEPKTFAPLAQCNGIRLYSLQKMSGTNDLQHLTDTITIHEFGPDFDKEHGRFMDTAAVIKNLDLIITIDTSIAHLAGGLGVPVWCLLPEPADWRWMLDRNDTPWYPNMRLFRQPKPGDWESVIQEIVHELNAMLNNSEPDTNTKNTKKSVQTNDPDIINYISPIAELIDKLTYLAAQYEQNALSTEDMQEYSYLQKEYERYVQQQPELELLKKQLFETHRQKERLTRKNTYADKLKESIKKKIALATQALIVTS